MIPDNQALALLSRLAVALCIGLLVGIERGWQDRDLPEGGRTAGVRTYSLIGLLGGVSAALIPAAGPWPLVAALVALAVAFAAFKYREGIKDNDYSVTGVVAALLTFVLGAVAVIGPEQVAISSAVAMTVLLASRKSLHAWLRELTWKEFRSGLLLVAMTFLALPLLPDRAVDPWGAINPHELWLLTIMIAAISGAGYVAIKAAGPKRGILFGALATGLVSSTSATLTSAQRVREGGSPEFLATGAALASAVSFLRTLAIALVVAPVVSVHLASALIPAAAVTAIMALLFWQQTKTGGENATALAGKLDNPIDLGFVLRFGLLLAVVLVLTKLATREFGRESFLALGAVMGFVDIDPVTLSASGVAESGTVGTASIGVLLAVTSNMLCKIVIGFVVGERAYGMRLMIILLAALIAGAVGLIAALMLHKP